MLADLDLLLIAVFCTADDLLPESVRNARRSVTDAEVVTLEVAQEMLGIDHDAEFLALARRLLGHLFPKLPQQPGYWKRRQRLSDTIEWLIGVFAAESPGFRDNVVLLDSTPVECGRSVETARRSQLADALLSVVSIRDAGEVLGRDGRGERKNERSRRSSVVGGEHTPSPDLDDGGAGGGAVKVAPLPFPRCAR
jgi:hypothetical protein